MNGLNCTICPSRCDTLARLYRHLVLRHSLVEFLDETPLALENSMVFALNIDGHLVEMEVKRLSPDNRTRFVEECLPPKARNVVVPVMDDWRQADKPEEKRFFRKVFGRQQPSRDLNIEQFLLNTTFRVSTRRLEGLRVHSPEEREFLSSHDLLWDKTPPTRTRQEPESERELSPPVSIEFEPQINRKRRGGGPDSSELPAPKKPVVGKLALRKVSSTSNATPASPAVEDKADPAARPTTDHGVGTTPTETANAGVGTTSTETADVGVQCDVLFEGYDITYRVTPYGVRLL